MPALIIFALLMAGCTAAAPDGGTDIDDIEVNGSVYFNFMEDEETDCAVVRPVDRVIENSANVPFELLQALFEGPTDAEKAEGYSSFFSSETADAVISLTIQGGTAYINLRDIRTVIPNASSSCGSSAFLAQINQTMTQLPGINRVILAIDGSTETIYEWLQIGCSETNDNCDNEPFRSGASSF